jgi:hypothetical protein
MPEQIDMNEAYKSISKGLDGLNKKASEDKMTDFWASLGKSAIEFFTKHFAWAVTLTCTMAALNSTGYFAIPTLIVFAPFTLSAGPAAVLIGLWLLVLVGACMAYVFFLALHYALAGLTALMKFAFRQLGKLKRK